MKVHAKKKILGIYALMTVSAVLFQNCADSRFSAAVTEDHSESTTEAVDASGTVSNGEAQFSANPVIFSQAALDASCLQNSSYDACIFLKNPVAANGGALPSPVDFHSDLSRVQTYGVRLTDLDSSGHLQNSSLVVESTTLDCGSESATTGSASGSNNTSLGAATDTSDSTTSATCASRPYRLTRTAQGDWKYPYSTSNNKAVAHLMAYYWLNYQINLMSERSGIFFARDRNIKVNPYNPALVNNARYDFQANSIEMGPALVSTTPPLAHEMALSAEIYLHEMGHANLHFGSNGNASRNMQNSVTIDRTTYCNDANGCIGAIHEGQADFHAALIFPDRTAFMESLVNNIAGTNDMLEALPGRAGGIPRDPARNSALTAQQAFESPAPYRRGGEIHRLGIVYSSAWWSLYSRTGVNKIEIEQLFSEHLRVLDGRDTFRTALSKLITLDRQLFGNRYSASIREEFGRHGIQEQTATTPVTPNLPSDVDSSIIGSVDSVRFVDGNLQVSGWGCKPQNTTALQFMFYVGGPAGTGRAIGYQLGNLSGEEAILQQCGSNIARPRFSFTIAADSFLSMVGQPVHVYGVHFGSNNMAYNQIGSSSPLRIPPLDIRGFIDGIQNVDGQTNLVGWACAHGLSRRLEVHAYAGGSAGSSGAVMLAGATASLPSSDAGVSQACGSSSQVFRYAIPLTNEQLQTYAGQRIYVHAISPSGDNNPLLSRSGEITLPVVTQPTSPSTSTSSTCTETEYLQRNPDVASAGANPFLHWLEHGRNEGGTRCQVAGRCTFTVTAAEYLRLYPDVAAAGLSARAHFESHGREEGRCAVAYFDPQAYLNANEDLAQAFGASNTVEATNHFCRYVVRGSESRPLSPGQRAFTFNTEKYLVANPDVRGNMDPASHACEFAIRGERGSRLLK